MNLGLTQTGDMCWFNASLNMFLTSDAGLKILWQKLQEVYKGFGPKQRAYFNSNISAPCPYKGSVRKTSSIYFWKFLNEYMCAIGGPGRVVSQSALNAFLAKNVKWRNAGTREAKGTAGGWPSLEIPALLGHLGFRIGSEFRMLNFDRWLYKFRRPEWDAQILMYRASDRGRPTAIRDLLLEKRGYALTGAILYIAPKGNSTRHPHVWCCSIRNGKGYVFESNNPLDSRECRWWVAADLMQYLSELENNFENYRPNRARVGYDVIMYTNKEFTSKISPTCQLPKGGYKELGEDNKNALRLLLQANNLVEKLPEARSPNSVTAEYPAAVRAHAVRQRAARPVMTAPLFNAIVAQATSFNNGLRRAQEAKNAYGANYRINTSGNNYKNFRIKLINKFPRPVPQHMFLFLLRNAKTNREFVNRLRKYALTTGHKVNENKIRSMLERRASTRAGAKRAAKLAANRLYLLKINNKERWHNGNNFVNNVNPNLWERANNNNVSNALASYYNTPNVKTFKRL